MVVVAALGTHSTGGYSILVDGASVVDSNGTAVAIRSVSPGPDCLVTEAFTEPVDIARMEMRSGPVTFRRAKRSGELQVIVEGDQAPNFSLEADDGTTVTRASLAGKNVVLYFYPKDDTPGCTKEACDFRDALPRFGKIDAVVIG